MKEWTDVAGEWTVMTVNDVVVETMNRVGLPLKHGELTSPSTNLDVREFERLLQRTVEVLAIRAGIAASRV